ncbi:MAG: glycosyl transferase family 1 [Flavobacterium sp. BFFFF2]|nr:MAG: glycosyl transferase family 1 [Flavobacterium sp. BFFFF2]
MNTTSILYIGNKLAKHGVNETSIDTLGPMLAKLGYQVYYASSFKTKALRLLHMLWQTIRYSQKVSFVLMDVYSTQNFYYALLVSQCCRLLKVPYLAKLHGGNLPHRLKRNPKLSQLIFANSQYNIAPSPYLLEAFEKAGFTNLLLIPNTLQRNQYVLKHRSHLRPRLLWVRSLQAIYNPEMALEVVRLLQKKYPDVQLTMVGPDKENYLPKLRQVVQHRQLPIHFTGKLSKKEWHQLAQNSDIFINTTQFDNTPVSVIEAMLLGLPVVSTDVGGMPFLIAHQQNGLLVPANDAEAMSQAIQSLIEQPAWAQALAQTAYERTQVFDWEVVQHQWLAILGEP